MNKNQYKKTLKSIGEKYTDEIEENLLESMLEIIYANYFCSYEKETDEKKFYKSISRKKAKAILPQYCQTALRSGIDLVPLTIKRQKEIFNKIKKS